MTKIPTTIITIKIQAIIIKTATTIIIAIVRIATRTIIIETTTTTTTIPTAITITKGDSETKPTSRAELQIKRQNQDHNLFVYLCYKMNKNVH